MSKKEPASGSVSRPVPVGLTYTGDASGDPYIGGIPARDLTPDDLIRLAGSLDLDEFTQSLLNTGIYVSAEKE
jgi:hypothetical protein